MPVTAAEAIRAYFRLSENAGGIRAVNFSGKRVSRCTHCGGGPRTRRSRACIAKPDEGTPDHWLWVCASCDVLWKGREVPAHCAMPRRRSWHQVHVHQARNARVTPREDERDLRLTLGLVFKQMEREHPWHWRLYALLYVALGVGDRPAVAAKANKLIGEKRWPSSPREITDWRLRAIFREGEEIVMQLLEERGARMTVKGLLPRRGMERALTSREAALFLGVGQKRIYQLVADGEVRAYNVGTTRKPVWRFDRRWLEDYRERHSNVKEIESS